MAALQPSKRSTPPQGLSALQRRPRRITLTINQATFERLQVLCDEQGRSLSNLCAYVLETATSACP
jgi:hypothetical protein